MTRVLRKIPVPIMLATLTAVAPQTPTPRVGSRKLVARAVAELSSAKSRDTGFVLWNNHFRESLVDELGDLPVPPDDLTINIMRIAAISDIHGNLDALKAVMGDILQRGVDAIVNLGDILSGPLLPAETSDFLMPLSLPTIRGNHERQLLTLGPDRMGASDAYARAQLHPRHLAWIAGLPASAWLTSEVFLCHGTPDNDLIYLLEDIEGNTVRASSTAVIATRAGDCSAEVILCGHSHVPRVVRLDDGRLLVNPGSVGLQAFSDRFGRPHVVRNGSPDARYALIERGGGGWNASVVCVPYDWHRMQRLAQERGRPDWVAALSTGWIHEAALSG